MSLEQIAIPADKIVQLLVKFIYHNDQIIQGDSLEQVYKVYGKPTYIFDDNAWFYGRFVWGGDNLFGIKFINDGTKVTEIFIG